MADTTGGGTATAGLNTQEAVNTINANFANLQDYQRQVNQAALIGEARLATDKRIFDAARSVVRDFKG